MFGEQRLSGGLPEAPEGRSGNAQHHLVGERGEVLGVEPLVHGEAHLQLSHALIHALQVARLVPGGGHERFLIFLYDARAKCGGGAPAGVEIQLVEPARGAGGDGAAARVPSPVNRWSEERIGVGISGSRCAGRVDYWCKSVLE